MKVPLTDPHRLAVVRELWAHARQHGISDGFRLLYDYEREAKAREERAWFMAAGDEGATP